MGDDRFLLLPAGFAPDPATMERLPALRRLVERLAGELPLDVHRWPWLHGEGGNATTPEGVISGIAAAIGPRHHVVDLGTGSDLLLMAVAGSPARSLSVAGFFASAATLRAAGEDSVAAAVAAITAMSVNATQILPVVMQGAAETKLDAIVREVDASYDRGLFSDLIRQFHETDYTGRALVTTPALYLDLPTPIPNPESLFAVFRRFVPEGRRHTLQQWGVSLHQEGAGDELADAVISFTREVIAAREAKPQT